MTLWFKHSNGKWNALCDCASKVDVVIAIRNFLDEHNYKSYYTRSWEENGISYYDVGSWSELFAWGRCPTKEGDLINE